MPCSNSLISFREETGELGMDDLRAVVKQVPPVTKTLVGSVLGLSVVSIGGLIPASFLANIWPWTVRKLQVWRLVTSFCIAGTGPEMLLNIFMLYRYSNDLEMIKFGSSTADYAFYLVFNCSLILVSPFFHTYSRFCSSIGYLLIDGS